MQNETIWMNVPESNVRVDMNYCHGAGLICDMHYHDEIELLLTTKGRLVCEVDDKKYIADEGEIIFVNSRTPHRTISPEEQTDYLLLQFRLNTYRGDRSLSDLIAYRVMGQSTAAVLTSQSVADAMKSILDESKNRSSAYNYMIKSDVYRILGELIRGKVIPDSEQNIDYTGVERIRPVLDYIEASYASPIMLEDASAMLGLNPSYFCRLFASVTGATFVEYVNFVRVRHSERLLRSTNRSVSEVSKEVGFASVTYYNRVFKKLTNCTPTVYRQLIYTNI